MSTAPGGPVIAGGAGAGAGAAAGAPAAGANGAAAPAAGGWSISSILRAFMMYYVVTSLFKGSNKSAAPVTDVATGRVVYPHRPMWPENTPYDMFVYVHHTESLDLSAFTAAQLNPSRLVWSERGLVFGSWETANERALNWTFSDDTWPMAHLQANGTLYAHAFFVRDSTPLFKWREVGTPEDSYVHDGAEDALVVGEDGGATSYALSHGSVELTPLPSSSSEGFADRYVKSSRFVAGNILHRTMPLNVYRPAPKVVDKKNLLGVGAQENVSSEVALHEKPAEVEEELPFELEEEEEELQEWLEDDEDGGVATVNSRASKGVSKSRSKGAKAAPFVSFWKPFLSIRLIPDFTVFPTGGIPEEMKPDYVIDPTTNMYAPVVYFDYFWLLTDQLIPINQTVSTLSLNMSHSPLSLTKWRIEIQMEASWKMQQSWGMQEEDGRESELLKKMILETNIYLLVLTFAISMLHMVFDFLAFKSDVSFWQETKTVKGLSTRSILLNCFCQLIIFLYLLDNDTSYMILLSTGVGIGIEVWKVQKALVLTIDRTRPFPHIRIQNKSLSEDKPEEEKTDEEKELELHAKYDAEAMTMLSYALYPLLLGYAAYSLYYDSHKSWYSFVLSTLTGCVYTFGFIMMCPQLYMNYKLKSVAHLPWRMLTYKALNTFIDDLFAFVITMPTLHRLACLRDDIIFIIFLVQKYKYRVDYSRVNEFGAVFISEQEKLKIEEDDRKQRLAAMNVEAEAKRGAYLEEIKDEEEKTTTAAAAAPTSAEKAAEVDTTDATSSASAEETAEEASVPDAADAVASSTASSPSTAADATCTDSAASVAGESSTAAPCTPRDASSTADAGISDVASSSSSSSSSISSSSSTSDVNLTTASNPISATAIEAGSTTASASSSAVPSTDDSSAASLDTRGAMDSTISTANDDITASSDSSSSTASTSSSEVDTGIVSSTATAQPIVSDTTDAEKTDSSSSTAGATSGSDSTGETCPDPESNSTTEVAQMRKRKSKRAD